MWCPTPLDNRLSTGNRTSVTWQMRPRPDTPGENSPILTYHNLLPVHIPECDNERFRKTFVVARSRVKPTRYSLDHDVVGMLISFDINEQISAANDEQVLDDDKYL